MTKEKKSELEGTPSPAWTSGESVALGQELPESRRCCCFLVSSSCMKKHREDFASCTESVGWKGCPGSLDPISCLQAHQAEMIPGTHWVFLAPNSFPPWLLSCTFLSYPWLWKLDFHQEQCFSKVWIVARGELWPEFRESWPAFLKKWNRIW